MQATEEREAARPGTHDGRASGPPVMGRYHLMRQLGAGGFGTVHEAWDDRLERWVAVKVIPADGAAPERARREARAAARLDHPNVVALYDAGEAPGRRFLVCELVDGATMAELQAEDQLGDRDVLRIGLAMADALEHAHERGVVHRDLKPQNVLVPASGRRAGAAKLTDFGVAHLAGDEALTRTGDVIGTIAYMAPEQAAGRPVDARADLYALALVVYEGLAGAHPVRSGNATATARRVGTVLPTLEGHRPDLPPDLIAAVDRALAPDPDDRGTIAELAMAFADALPEVEDEVGTIAPHPLERRLEMTPLHARVGAGVLTGILCALAVAALTPEAAVHPLTMGLAAAAITTLLPRAGWILSVLACALAIVVGPAPRAGAATLLLLGALPIPLLARHAVASWSLPALAPALGVLGAAGAYPALAGLAATPLRRAALGVLGVWVAVIAEPLLERTLLLGAPDGVPPRARFDGGISLAIGDVLLPLVSSPALLLAPLWAAAAVVLPWLLRGRSLSADAVLAAAWAGGLSAATGAIAVAAGAPEPRMLALSAVVGAVLAVAARWVAMQPGTRY